MPYSPGDTLLNKYRLEALLGQGAFGGVYRVTHLELKVFRALKILRRDAPGIGSTEFNDGQARFQLEAQLGAMLNTPTPHPNLLQIHDFIRAEDLLVLEMEYALGGSLAERLEKLKARSESMSIAEALQIAKEVASGLAALHAKDIVHRDLKPSNILFDDKGHAKVADLGLAQIAGGPSLRSQLSNPQAHPGTPGYMSPEQEHERGLLRPPSDVYALGLVLFEMLTGRNYALMRPGTQASSLRAEIPAGLDGLLARMLAKSVEERPWNGSEVADLLHGLIQQQAEQQKTNQLARETAERTLLEAQNRAAEQAQRERLAREAAEEAAREQEARAVSEKVAQEQAKREAAEKALREKSTYEAALRAKREREVTGTRETRTSWLAVFLVGVISILLIVGLGAIVLWPRSTPAAPIATVALAATESPTIVSAVTQAPVFSGGSIGTLKIVSSLPMTGSSLTQTQTMVNAMILRVEQASGIACGGKYKLYYESWDDASAALGKWDPAVETENANKAAADKSIIAYLGTFNSGAARLSIPILNQAGPLVMISPANTNPGLTKADKDLPGVTASYYPSGVRNYTRVVSADDVQGKVGANFVKALGARTVYILDDHELYGMGIADNFETTAKSIGLKILGREGIDPKAADYRALMTKISTSNSGTAPDAIYVGMVVDNNAAQLLKDKVAIMGDNTKVKYVGPDGIQTQALIDGAGANVAEGVYASVAGVPLDKLPAPGQQFVRDYEAKYGQLTEPYAVYGYETMNVILKAIEDVCATGGDPTDRATITKAVFAIKDFNGALGTWSFDKNGDTSLTDMTFYQVQSGSYVAVGTFK